MDNITSQPAQLRLAIAPGVSSSQLSALLALQRAEEPEVSIAFSEVAGDELLDGLREGRYDVGMSLQGASDPALETQSLWIEHMAVAMPLRFPLLDQASLTIADLQNYPIFRWRDEACSSLDRRLLSLQAADQQNLQYVTSFEMMALWVSAGYGVGVSAQSRIKHAHGWGVSMRPLDDGSHEIVTHLHRPQGQANPVSERFERRALHVAQAQGA
ncbi:LysR family substrate-binding domain-containing protein [Achromobacter mucicolens]|uniref:LysR family substrate-binding domain-containing protein n=1 Tax=Achromobacter mucicolens TaxID=1389922 RepID=A0ABD4YPP2_9BURK|nr:LysR family substrate-binding domain-containing protein [Achromobacter mucicolens]MDH1177225.1 LysR family substrate-binding domain-containing protein [Achromobacter mucicolens]